jgi:hypothetical protein
MAHSVPVFYFDFKNLNEYDYKKMISKQIRQNITGYVDINKLDSELKSFYDDYVRSEGTNTEGILFLTELVYKTTGKRSYVLIDEYDKLLTDNCQTEYYEEIKKYETSLLSAGLKGNKYLEKALLTGVLRVSRESLLSGLNNLETYDLFSDTIYTDDFGFTEAEMDELNKFYDFNKETVRDWYNGVKIKGKAIYNTFSVLSYLSHNEFNNYWGNSGTLEIVRDIMTPSRQESITHLLNGEAAEIDFDAKVSFRDLLNNPGDLGFYSLLMQAGLLSLESVIKIGLGTCRIPNIELMNVWTNFVLDEFVTDKIRILSLFDSINDPGQFSEDLQYVLNNSLSFHDFGKEGKKKPENVYHAFTLGVSAVYKGSGIIISLQSNKESGAGRFDVTIELKDYYALLEFKVCKKAEDLEKDAEEALRQIDKNRYYANLSKDKKVMKVGIAFFGIQCKVICRLHEWN